MTLRLFDRDSFLREFEAGVLECTAADGGRFAAVLDQTAFCPEGGGQKSDTGCLNNVRVLDVQEKNGRIYHYTDAPLAPGGTVRGKIDWEQRFSRMQNHTGEHIVSGLVHSLYGGRNVGFHLNKEEVTMDYDVFLDAQALENIELQANRVVARDIPVKAWYPSNPREITYRSKLALTENIRLVEIEGVDVCACCAPHVARTGQTGMIKLTEAQRYKGGVRLHMKCGFRALAEFQARQKCLEELSQLLSLPWAETAQGVRALKQRAEESDAKYRKAVFRLLRERLARQEYTEGNLCIFIEEASLLKEAANALKEKCAGMAGVFCGSDREGYRYMILSSRAFLPNERSALQAALQARGGGGGNMLQGYAAAPRKIIENCFRDGFDIINNNLLL